ncbi:hypothetical protein [Corynebacterium cystitidis]|uniref:hypothetical protein n=1 Tax=Corynebacterium cystitidis TaxID=35757 RepID=UPI00211EFE20|nr:hypothetical protein [Corynebacterium cystitidis]
MKAIIQNNASANNVPQPTQIEKYANDFLIKIMYLILGGAIVYFAQEAIKAGPITGFSDLAPWVWPTVIFLAWVIPWPWLRNRKP